MTACRRAKLPEVGKTADNPGLVFQKWLAKQEEGEKEAAPRLLDAMMASEATGPYKAAFERWNETVTSINASTVSAECLGPLAIGLGNESPLEVGLTFNHTYGMPVIPGSAVKGLVRKAAMQGRLGSGEFKALFGFSEGKEAAAGCVVFFDAWFDPSSVGGKPFHRDVVTVHHPEYYKTRGGKPPTDFDDPTPIPFLVVKPGAKFLFAINGPSHEWESFALGALGWALEALGIGAKTNAGYGRLRLDVRADSTAGAVAARHSETETWEGVQVSFKPGNQELDARNGDKKGSAKLTDLRATLDEDALAKLTGKARKITADIEVTPVGGKNYRIVAIRPTEAT